jgi:hypothetical protein
VLLVVEGLPAQQLPLGGNRLHRPDDTQHKQPPGEAHSPKSSSDSSSRRAANKCRDDMAAHSAARGEAICQLYHERLSGPHCSRRWHAPHAVQRRSGQSTVDADMHNTAYSNHICNTGCSSSAPPCFLCVGSEGLLTQHVLACSSRGRGMQLHTPFSTAHTHNNLCCTQH